MKFLRYTGGKLLIISLTNRKMRCVAVCKLVHLFSFITLCKIDFLFIVQPSFYYGVKHCIVLALESPLPDNTHTESIFRLTIVSIMVHRPVLLQIPSRDWKSYCRKSFSKFLRKHSLCPKWVLGFESINGLFIFEHLTSLKQSWREKTAVNFVWQLMNEVGSDTQVFTDAATSIFSKFLRIAFALRALRACRLIYIVVSLYIGIKEITSRLEPHLMCSIL